jgi:glycosyltransferase involved in cell wall biosynthesis
MSAQAYGDRGRLQLLYSGVFYDVQTPDFFLRSLAAFLAQRPEARSKVEASFLGLVPAASKALIGQLGLADVVGLEGYRPHQAVIEALQAADVLWMTVGRGKGQETISTSKLFEYMGARKPILGLVPEGAARDALQTYGASFIAPPDDEQAILAQLTEIYSRWEQNRLPEPDEVHITQFDRSRLTVQLGELLDRLAINRNTA